MNTLFIDAPNLSVGNKIYNRLKTLRTTESITRPVNYRFGAVQNECILTVVTSKTEDELDAWLYRSAGLDYIGCGMLVNSEEVV